MARYVDIDDFRQNAYYADTDIDIGIYLMNFGCADVVPKSEVEQAIREFASIILAHYPHTQSIQNTIEKELKKFINRNEGVKQ